MSTILAGCCWRWPIRPAPNGLLVEPDDGRHGGWSHERVRPGARPGARPPRDDLVDAATDPRCSAPRIDRLVRRDQAKLTADRVAYFCHPDWMVDPGRGAPEGLWRPTIDTEQGLAETARWYRAAGLALELHQPVRSAPTAIAVTSMPTRNMVKLQ